MNRRAAIAVFFGSVLLITLLVGVLAVSSSANAEMRPPESLRATPTYTMDEHFVDDLSWCIEVDAHTIRDCLVLLAAAGVADD